LLYLTEERVLRKREKTDRINLDWVAVEAHYRYEFEIRLRDVYATEKITNGVREILERSQAQLTWNSTSWARRRCSSDRIRKRPKGRVHAE
jgi:hypothetical protein